MLWGGVPRDARGGSWPPWHGYFGLTDYMLLYLGLAEVPGVDDYMRLRWAVGGQAGSPL